MKDDYWDAEQVCGCVGCVVIIFLGLMAVDVMIHLIRWMWEN